MIKIENLSFGYTKNHQLFDGLNISAERGSIIGLLGKNGAGKSTLLRLISGLLKPHKGSLLINNNDPFQRKPSFLQQVFLVPEEFAIPATTIKSYVRTTGPLYPNFDFKKMDVICKQFELETTQNLGKMSYGQKKKFLIAFALSTNCKLLVLDEPTNGLDIPSKALFRKIMAGALTEKQMVIISTHQVRDIENLIDRILVIDNGKLIFNQSVLKVCQNVAFHTVSSITGVDCLYQEAAPGGYRILQAKNGDETQLDIELLFNALISGTKIEIDERSI